jgi:hypothetical protein
VERPRSMNMAAECARARLRRRYRRYEMINGGGGRNRATWRCRLEEAQSLVDGAKASWPLQGVGEHTRRRGEPR